MQIHESAEDYLEAILKIQEQKGNVRSIDIVDELNYSKPSISIAMKKLRENGYIEMDNNGLITLNPSGREIAERIYERHKLLSSLLCSLGVDKNRAQEEACKIEHDIDDDTFRRIKEYYHAHVDEGVLN